MNIIVNLLILALDIYLWLIIATVLMSWLVTFNVVNIRNKWVYKFNILLSRATEPGLAFFRRFIPPFGGIDFTPIAMMLGIYLLQNVLMGLLR